MGEFKNEENAPRGRNKTLDSLISLGLNSKEGLYVEL